MGLIEIEVRVFANLGRHCKVDLKPGEARSLSVEEGTTLKKLVEEKLALPPEAVKVIFVNGQATADDYLLAEGDRVGIFPPVAGGIGH